MPEIPSTSGLNEELARICDQIRLTRRTVVGILAGGVATSGTAAAQALRSIAGVQIPAQNTQIDLRYLPIRLLRADDMVVLNLYLDNLRLVGSPPTRQLERIQPGQPARLIFEHQPQAIEDRALFSQPLSSYGPVSLLSYIAGPSYVVFAMPAGVNSQPLQGDGTLAGLLDICSKWPMSLDVAARPYGPVTYDGPGLVATTQANPNALQATLDHYGATLRTALPPEQQAALAGVLAIASARVSESMTTAARSGHPMSDTEVDQLISREVDTRLGSSPPRTGWQRLLAHRSVEAAATGNTANQTRNNNSDVHVVGAKPPPAQTNKPQQPTRLGRASPLAALAAAALAAARQKDEQRQPPVEVTPIGPLPLREAPSTISQLLNKPHQPSDAVTAIEIPYRLIQSPLMGGGWKHATEPVTQGGYRTEIWHTRLGARTRQGPLAPWTVDDKSPAWIRAIWSEDYPDGQQNMGEPQFSLDPFDRCNIVKLTADYSPGLAYTPRPTLAKRLMLTALGGWLEAEGNWPQPRPSGNDLQNWTHRTAMGRDYYARVVYAGFLFPFGHAASLVELTERRFEDGFNGSRAAVLHKRDFIVVREPSRSYPQSGVNGNDFPFKTVEITTKTTPDLNAVNKESTGFTWLTLLNTSTEFEFALVGIDGSGRRIPFTAPLCFLPASGTRIPNDYPDQGRVRIVATDDYTEARSTRPLGGAMLQFAENSDKDTSFPADYIVFGHKVTGTPGPMAPFFQPILRKAGIRVPAVERLMNTSTAFEVSYPDVYKNSGFSGNPQEIFLEVVSGASKLGINQSDPGAPSFAGLISPDLTPGMLSRSHGPLAGSVANALAKPFDPSTLFPDVKLLGIVSIGDLLKNAIGEAASMPQITTKQVPDGSETSYTFHCGNLSGISIFQPEQDAALDITTTVHVSSNGDAPRTTIDGTLSDFDLEFVDILKVRFARFHLHADPGAKPQIDVNFNMPPVALEGALGTIGDIMSYIPGGGFSDPVSLSVSPTGLTAGISLSIPDIAAGDFTLENVSIGGQVTVPFTGQSPSLRFNFAERSDPFILTYDLLGGDGYFNVTIDSGGVQEL